LTPPAALWHNAPAPRAHDSRLPTQRGNLGVPVPDLARRKKTTMKLPDLSLLLVMAVFWATFVVLRASVFRPLGAILEEREKKAADAADLLAKSLDNEKETLAALDRRLTEARREAIAVRQAARTEANATRQAILEKARDDARRLGAEAQGKLEKSVAAVRKELRASARATAAEIASLALGRKVA
jgi:F-type H+-transporting ATPase subunit b